MPEKIFKISLETQLLYERLLEAKPGELIPYEELNAIAGRNVQHEGYACLYSARKKARNTNRLVFGVIANVGLRCLENDEIVGSAYDLTRQSRNRAREGFKTLICSDYSKLPDVLKVKHNTIGTLCRLITICTTPKKVAQLESFMSEKMEQLTYQQTLQFFEGK